MLSDKEIASFWVGFAFGIPATIAGLLLVALVTAKVTIGVSLLDGFLPLISVLAVVAIFIAGFRSSIIGFLTSPK